jgi:hypothetical protein
MAASYPGAVKTFTTKAAGGAILAAHINDLQDEVKAVETQLGVNAGTWQSWTPSYLYTGGTTDYTIVTTQARYTVIGKMVTVNYYGAVTVGTGDRTAIYFDLPVAPRYLIAAYAMENCVTSDRNIRPARLNTGTGRAEIYLPSKFTVNGTLHLAATYEVA